MPSRITFGPALPPLEHMTGIAGGNRSDAVTVEGEPGRVAHDLAKAVAGGSWPKFEAVHRGNKPIFVNPASVRHVEEAPEG